MLSYWADYLVTVTSLCRLSELSIISCYKDGKIIVRSLQDSTSFAVDEDGGVQLENMHLKPVHACCRLNESQFVSLGVNHSLVLWRKNDSSSDGDAWLSQVLMRSPGGATASCLAVLPSSEAGSSKVISGSISRSVYLWMLPFVHYDAEIEPIAKFSRHVGSKTLCIHVLSEDYFLAIEKSIILVCDVKAGQIQARRAIPPCNSEIIMASAITCTSNGVISDFEVKLVIGFQNGEMHVLNLSVQLIV